MSIVMYQGIKITRDMSGRVMADQGREMKRFLRGCFKKGSLKDRF